MQASSWDHPRQRAWANISATKITVGPRSPQLRMGNDHPRSENGYNRGTGQSGVGGEPL
jgi:hypothetical protein